MKLFGFFGLALATDGVPHDPEALAYCHNACRGTDISYPDTGYCHDGFYASVKDCDACYLCWDSGNWADKFWCSPGAVFNPATGECGWPCNLPEDNECFIPAASQAEEPIPINFCKTACGEVAPGEDRGASTIACAEEDLVPNPNCPDSSICPNGFYPSNKDCDAYYICWNDGEIGEKYQCAPGAVYNPVTKECDWPFNIPEDHECYVPAK